jgi:hypothetical protein
MTLTTKVKKKTTRSASDVTHRKTSGFYYIVGS